MYPWGSDCIARMIPLRAFNGVLVERVGVHPNTALHSGVFGQGGV